MSTALVIRGGRVLEADGFRRADVAVDDAGRVEAVGEVGVPDGATVLDADGCLVLPGLVDLGAHLREPGDERSETVATAARAAALGGYTAVVALPDTDPPVDSASMVRDVRALAVGAACEILVAGTVTVGRAGYALGPLAEMAALGVRLVSDEGGGVQDDRVMRRALEYASVLGVTIAEPAERTTLAAGGVMHEGAVSSRLGLPGRPAEAEELLVMRDVALAQLTGAPVHFRRVSTAGSLAVIRAARAGGLPVTADVTPHHLTFTDEACCTFDPVHRVDPPLRTSRDRAALVAAVTDGTVDAVATDHAPCAAEQKDQPFAEAAPGVTGLQTAFSAATAALDAAPEVLVERMSTAPARIAGVADRHGGPVRPGREANLCVVDPDAEWTMTEAAAASRSSNDPWIGRPLRGRVRHTVLAGRPTVIDGEPRC